MSHFLPPSDPRLNQVSAEVPLSDIASKEIQELIDRMFTISGGERGDPKRRGLVGLAAPQMGVMKRVIMVDIGVDTTRREWGKLREYINPQIIERSDEEVLDREGCFSVDNHVCGLVPRAKWIKVKAYNREGQEIIEEHFDYTARIFQHEIDHLDGKRFPDRVGSHGTLHWVEEDQYPDYRLQWSTWPARFPWDGWLAMKSGKPYQRS